MIATDLSKLLADLPDEALIPVGWVRARLDAPAPVEADGDLSCADVAALLRRKPGTIRGWCFRKEISGAYLLNGRDWRIPRKSLRAYLDKQAAGKSVDRTPVDLSSWRKKARRSH
jgi:hypothetical protein